MITPGESAVGPACSRPSGAPSRSQVDERPAEPSTIYEIRVRSVLDRRWSSWFEGLDVSSDTPDESVIVGPVTDQAALHGLLTKVRDLGLPLISVRVIGRERQ